MGSNIGGSLELITVASPLGRGAPRKRTARELIPAAHRYCCLSRSGNGLGRSFSKPLTTFNFGDLAPIVLQHEQPNRRRKVALLTL